MTQLGVPRPVTLSILPTIDALCPYLLSAEGTWRASTASRDHRCTAVTPAAILAADKQRRMCLVAEHADCSTYAAASAVTVGGPPRPPRARPTTRPLARTTPVVLDQGRLSRAGGPILPQRAASQGGLVALMAVAFGAIAVARLTAGGPDLRPTVGNGASAGPSVAVSGEPTIRATAGPAVEPGASPVRTLVPSEVQPTVDPVEPSTASTPGPTTYAIKRGDTLSGVAAEFETTWQVLAEINGIADPGRLRVGQVLQLP